ncbi:MAG TPA: hypothetical protein VK942_11365 [Actinomycetes bacterium]|nr:hypothetical protein [Actinomycetes bacterium]
MTDPTSPLPGPPSWGQPPSPRKRRLPPWAVVVAVLGAGLLFVLLAAAVLSALDVGETARVSTAATDPPATVADDQTPVTDPPETTEAKPEGPPVARVGQTLEMTDGFGDTVAEVTVGGPTSPSRHRGVRFSTGGEYDTPKHGLYLGVWVKVKAFQDGVETVYGDLHVVQGGKHYPGDACCPDGFKPTLDYATLSKGETSEGWVIFDLRSRKGEIVIANYDGKRLGAWRF